MGFRILLLLLGNTAAVLGARFLLGFTRTGSSATNVVVFLILRLVLISATVLLAGLTWTLNPWILGAFSAGALAALLSNHTVRGFEWSTRPAWNGAMWAILGIVFTRLLLQVWFFTPFNLDALSYHLPKIPEWVRAGGFTPEMGVDTHASLPAGYELLETWWVIFLGHDVLIEMAGVEFLVLAFASCYAVADQLGWSPGRCCLAGLLFILTPGLHLQATSCLNDGAVAATLASTMALVLARAPIGATLAVACLGIGIKGTFLYALPGVMLLEVLLRKQCRVSPTSPSGQLALVGLGLWIGTFWYLRNWLWYGSPIYPITEHGLISGVGQEKIQFGPSLISAVKNIISLGQRLIGDFILPYPTLLQLKAGWGPFATILGFLGLAWGLRNEARLRPVFYAFVTSLASVLLLVRNDPWNLRFVLFFPMILSLGVLCLPLPAKPQIMVVGFGLLWQFVSSTLPAEIPPHALVEFAKLGWRERSVTEISGPRLESEPSVAFYVREPVTRRAEAYALYGPSYSRRVVYVRSDTLADILGQMDRQNTFILYISSTSTLPEGFLEGAVRSGTLRQIGERLYEHARH